MTLAASGVRSLVVQRGRKLLAASSTWQTWTGHAGDATNAEAHVHDFEKAWAVTDEKDTPETDVCAIVDLAGCTALPTTRVYAGEVRIRIEAPVLAAYADSPSEAFRDFENRVGAIFDELLTASRADTTNTYLALREEGCRAEPCLRVNETEADSDGDRMVADLVLAFGPRG